MDLEVLRKDMIVSQRKGQPFIVASIIIWVLITLVTMMKVSLPFQNLLIFCCSCPLLPLSWFVGKWLNVDIFSKENPLTNLGFLFTCNQLLCGSLVRYLKKCLWFIQWFLERIFYPIHGYINQEHILFLLF